jgi:hypothetical protein
MRYSKTEHPYITGKFTTGDTCTITMYDLYNNKVIVDTAPMTEVGSSGYFKYRFVPTLFYYTEYLCVMTNSVDEQVEKIELGGYMDKVLGLVHQNISIDQPTYDDDDNLIGSRLRIYSESESVGSNDNVISEYTISSTGIGRGKFSSWQQIEDVENHLLFEDDSGSILLEDGSYLLLG